MSDKNFTFNFTGPVGQTIANVEHMEVHMDKDGQIQVMSAEQVTATPEPIPQPQEQPVEQPSGELTAGTIDQHLKLFKEAMLKVQDIKYSEMKYEMLIANTYDWYAVLRLGKDLGLVKSYDELMLLMKDGDFKCKPNAPQNFNQYRQHINDSPLYPGWQFSHPASEPFFRKFLAIANNTYSVYCTACKINHIKPYGSK